MGFVVGLFLFVLGLLAIASTFKKPKNEDEAKKLEMFKKHKWKYRIGGYFLISIGFVLMFPDTLPSTNTSQQTSQTKQAVETADTSKSTVQTSKQQAVSYQREVKHNYASRLSGTQVRKALVSFYKQHYPEATVQGYDIYVIDFPYKNIPIYTVPVGRVNVEDSDFAVVCFMGRRRFERNLGPNECLATEDKAGRSIIDAFYHIYKIKKPTEADFIAFLRHKCIERECNITDMTVESVHKKYKLTIDSQYLRPTVRLVKAVWIMVQ